MLEFAQQPFSIATPNIEERPIKAPDESTYCFPRISFTYYPHCFIKGQPIETFKVGKSFTIVIADTGVPAPTKESVGDVRKF